MFTATADLSDFHRLRDRTKREIRGRLGAAVTEAAEQGRDEANRAGKFKDHTGELRRDIVVRDGRVTSDGGVEVSFVALKPYASFVADGTEPHIIRPKEGHGFIGPLPQGQSRRARTDIGTARVALRWFVGGQPRFARLVHHPGSRAYPFMGPGYLKAERVLYAELERGFVTIESLWS